MIRFSDKQADFIRLPFDRTLDVAEGSPRSGKTFAGISRYARHLLMAEDKTHLVVGYSAEQAYRLIMEGDGFGLLHFFAGVGHIAHDDTGAHLLLNLPNGQKKVYWKGGGKADSHKSITGLSLGSVYFCEIDLLHQNMIQECFRRTYAAKDRWHIADLNPPSPRHPVITDVFDVQDTRWTHWRPMDNPILTPKRLKEIEATCAKSPFLYKRDWLGERAIPKGVIYWMFDSARHILQDLPQGITPVEMYFAGDGGTTDATSIGCYIVGGVPDQIGRIRDYRLFRVGNWYYDGGNMAMSDQAKHICGEFMPYMRSKWRMRETCVKIDPACKALRLEIEKHGVGTDKADNNGRDIKGSTKGLKVGVEMLQSGINDGLFFMVEDPQYGTEAAVKELGLYCADDNGQPIDAYNHAMDEMRYAYNYFAKNYGKW